MRYLKDPYRILKKYHSILELAIIQGANAVFPVLVFPFMLISLGADIFKDIALGEVLALYTLIFSMYSFDIISVQKVISSITVQEKYKVYILTLLCRLGLFILSSSILLIITYLINKTLSFYFLLFLLYPLGMILQSNYFFQATNDNKALAFFVLITRSMSVLLIYFYEVPNLELKSFFYVFFVSGAYFFSGLLSMLLVLYKNRKNKISIGKKDFVEYIKNGYYLFLANVFVILYRNSNVLILGFLASPIATSLYATAEKIIKSVQSIATPVNQFYFTKLVKEHKSKNEEYKAGEYKKLITSCTVVQLKIMFAISMVLIIAGLGVFYFFENLGEIRQALAPLFIMLFSIFMGIYNFMFGSVGMSVIGLKKEFSHMTVITGISTIVIALILIPLLAESGAAIAYVSAELILLLLIARLYKLKNL